MTGYCLWIKLLWYCSDYFNTELSVLNIWVFLGIIWVFFTWYQLLDGTHKLRLSYRNTKIITYRLLWISFVGIIIATSLPFIPWYALPFIWYSISWEILVALICMFLIIYNFVSARRPIKKVKHSKRLYNISLNSIASWWKHIEAFVIEAAFFFKNLFKNILKWDGYSHNILINMLSNNFIDELIRSHPFTLQEIFKSYVSLYEKIWQDQRILEEFFQAVFFRSLQDRESFISREINDEIHKHYNRWKWILLSMILDDFKFIDRFWLLKWIPFNISKQWNQDVYSHNFVMFWYHTVPLYFSDIKHNIYLYKNIYNWLSQIAWIIQNSPEVSHVDIHVYGLTNNIPIGLQEHSWEILESYWGKRPEYSYLNSKDFRVYIWHHWDMHIKNILDALAFWMFDCFLASTTMSSTIEIKDKQRSERNYSIAIEHLLWFNWKDAIFIEIKKRLNILFEIKILENLKWYYPMASRAFWNAYWWQLFNTDDKLTQSKDSYINILRIFAENLPKLKDWFIYAYSEDQLQKEYYKNYTQNKAIKIIADLFPDNMNYDSIQNKLFYYFWDRSSWSSIDLNRLLETGKIEIENP